MFPERIMPEPRIRRIWDGWPEADLSHFPCLAACFKIVEVVERHLRCNSFYIVDLFDRHTGVKEHDDGRMTTALLGSGREQAQQISAGSEVGSPRINGICDGTVRFVHVHENGFLLGRCCEGIGQKEKRYGEEKC